MQVVMNVHQNDFCLILQYWFAVAGVISVFIGMYSSHN